MSGKWMCLSSMTILWELTLIQVKLVTADLKWQSRSENSFVAALLFTCFKCCLKKYWMPGENQEKKNISLTVQTFQYQLHCQCKIDWSSTETSWKAARVKLNGSPYNQASQQVCRCNTQGLLFGDKISSNWALQKNGKKKSAPAKGGLNSASLKSSLCRDLFALLCRHSELLAEALVVKS